MNIYRLYRKLIPRNKPSWAALCKQVYIDKQGRRYYQYQDEGDMTLIRRGEIEKCQMELRYGSDYSDVIEGVRSSLNNANRKSGHMEPDIVTAGYLIQELIDRKGILVVPEILFALCSNTLIREDENPYLVDHEILEEKISTFKQEIQRGGLHAFFQANDLLKLVGMSNISLSDFNRLMTDSEQRISQVQAKIKLFTFEQKSHDSYSNRANIS